MRTYESYKDTGVEWIGEIPEHWEVKRLKYVAEVFPSNVDKKSKEDEDEILLCNYMDVYKNDYINSTIEFMNATASESQIKTFKLSKGDVLATKDSETPDDIAVSAYVEEDFDNVICGYHLTHIKPNSKNLIGLFLFRLLQSKNYCQYFTTLARGVTRYALNTSAFSEMPTIVPPIKEQIAIANYLDTKTTEIDQTIADKEALINLFEEEKKALINEAVTKGLNPKVKLKPSGIDWLGDIPEHWEVKKLKYVAYNNPSNVDKKSNADEKQILLCNYMDVYKNDYIIADIDFMSATATDSQIENFTLRNGDVLLTKDSETPDDIAVPALVKEDLEDVICGYHLTHIRCNTKIIKGDFLFNLFRVDLYRQYFSTLARGVTRYGLTTSSFSEMPTIIPPINEQENIVKHIETETTKINNQINLTKQEIELLKEYRQALIFEAVTGKICVL